MHEDEWIAIILIIIFVLILIIGYCIGVSTKMQVANGLHLHGWEYWWFVLTN